VPLLFSLWSYVQPAYSSLVTKVTNVVLAAEETEDRVTRLEAAGSRIRVWSSLRDDGEPANEFDADLLHFYVVLCTAIALAVPGPRGWGRIPPVLGTIAALIVFHVAALTVTIENTYANALVEVAKRNYSPWESEIYLWLYRCFDHFAVQLLPAVVLIVLFLRYGGLSGALQALRSPSPRDTAPSLEGRPRDSGRASGRVLVATASIVLVALAGVWMVQRGKIRRREAEALCMKGFSSLVAGSNAEALQRFSRSIALNPGFLEARDGEANALLALGRPADSEKAYRAALRIDPGYFPSMLGLGSALDALGRADEAIQEYGMAADSSPGRWEPRYNRAMILLRAKRPIEAEADLRRAVALAPDAAPPAFELAKILMTSGRLCEAVPHLERYIAMDPGSKQADLVRKTILTGKRDCAGK